MDYIRNCSPSSGTALRPGHSSARLRRMKLLFPLLLFIGAFAAGARAEEVTLKVGKESVHAEIASTRAARERGLMRRARLCADCGMLFVFPAAGRYGFWMKDTPLPLAVAFIGRDGRVINIEEMRPYERQVHYAGADALYALEMNGGWFAVHGVKLGDMVRGIPAVHAE